MSAVARPDTENRSGDIAAASSVPLPCLDQALAALADLEAALALYPLPQGAETSLTVKIDGMRRALESGKTSGVLGRLNAFSNEVRSLERRGLLDQEAAATLLHLVQRLKEVISGCSATPPVAFFNVRSATGTNDLFWVNPATSYAVTTILYRTDTYPEDAADRRAALLGTFAGTAGAVTRFTHSGLTDGVTYYYAAFVDDGHGVVSGPRVSFGRPFDSTGVVKWAYTAGDGGVPPGPSVSGGVYWFMALDGALTAVTNGSNGGYWAAGATPVRIGVPTMLPRPGCTAVAGGIQGSSSVCFVTSDDGRVYALDAYSGRELWRSPLLGRLCSQVYGDVAYRGNQGVWMIGTCSPERGDNKLYGLRILDGTVAWTFGNEGGGGLGPVNGAAVNPADPSQACITARTTPAGGGGGVFALRISTASFTPLWSSPLGDVTTSCATAWNRTNWPGGGFLLGTADGAVHMLDEATGAPRWTSPYLTADGPLKSYAMFDHYNQDPRRALGASDTLVHVIDASGDTPASYYDAPVPFVTYANPVLYPLQDDTTWGPRRLWLGSRDGRLCTLDYQTRSPRAPRCITLGDPAIVEKDVAYGFRDPRTLQIIVTTDEGVAYLVEWRDPFWMN